MAEQENAARKAAGKLDETASYLGGGADRAEGETPGYDPITGESEARAAAAAHGDRLVTNPDGSHQVISEVEVDQEPDRLSEAGAAKYDDPTATDDREDPQR